MSNGGPGLPLASTGGREAVAESFRVLSNSIRPAVPVVLWEVRTPWERQVGLWFSEPYDRVEVDGGRQSATVDSDGQVAEVRRW